MSAIALQGRRALSLALDIWPIIVVLAAIAIGAFTVVTEVSSYYRGKYAGMHYGTAKSVAINALIVKYGRSTAGTMHFAVPPVVNTHSRSLFRDGQVRVFHVVGQAGARYCITVWNPRENFSGNNRTGIDIGGDASIVKGCSF